MIQRLRLENFKGVVEGEVELDKLTILVGPNNSGKTTILEALFLAPNPFRQVPYATYTAAELLRAYHAILNESGYSFLLHKYIAEKTAIKVDDKEITFLKRGLDLYVYVDSQPHGFVLPQHMISGRNLYCMGSLPVPIEGIRDCLITSNTLLLSTKLVNFASEYLRLKWMEIVNTGATATVAKEVSKHVYEEYVNLTAEPFVGGASSLFAMLADGTRIRLSDLGAGVHLYIVNRLLHEHYRPEVVLWDDVETHLNPRLLIHVAEWFADLVEEGNQVVVSTHSLEAAETITTFVKDATILLTSLKGGMLRGRKIKLDELETLTKLGVDPRIAETLL